MSNTYTAQRKKNLFSTKRTKPYKLSRSRIEDFITCARCFYIDRKCGTEHPGSYPYSLNNAVDLLLKKEFDQYRAQAKPHPQIAKYMIDAVPFTHPAFNSWREHQKGITYHHAATSFMISGAVDDIWINSHGQLIVVDYKAISTTADITRFDFRNAYKRQVEVYQWLLRKNGFDVSATAYFLFCNADTQKDSFNGSLDFKIMLLPYHADGSWIESTLFKIRACLESDTIPSANPTCHYCQYWYAVKKHHERTP